MPAINESGLKEVIKNNPVGIFLIHGEEGYLKKAYVEKIVSKTVDEAFADFNFHTFDGKECSLSEIYESAGAVPMMSETKCVLVKDFPLDTLDDNDWLYKVCNQENYRFRYHRQTCLFRKMKALLR